MPDPFPSDRKWRLNPSVAIRPEPFGALLYHFGTRKLSFLKNTTIVDVVRSLDGSDCADDALAAHGVTDEARSQYLQALAALAASEMIVRDTQKSGVPHDRAASTCAS